MDHRVLRNLRAEKWQRARSYGREYATQVRAYTATGNFGRPGGKFMQVRGQTRILGEIRLGSKSDKDLHNPAGT